MKFVHIYGDEIYAAEIFDAKILQDIKLETALNAIIFHLVVIYIKTHYLPS